ncbi:acyl-CoA dehydrogenase family protein [Diaphorobacter caeni]|uniref:acyl-CoA dehydrogenase family protein n=1 Tax=Diaphorobacter caeni TaxID=2784387 RepID=UPI00188E7CDF|nr:acyl-CoA dehydrogenase family protein [Diaphorobacter caeni]MBF5004302.1 acyl-CoA/acyl-ACP dehydrogenase [Diaphorobacter caeni]
MDFQLSQDQRAFADMAQSLFADYCNDDKLREHDISGQPYMQSLWQQCVTAGLHSILIPESAGGLGLGMTELLAVLVQQGRALAQVPLWQVQVAADTLAKVQGNAAAEQAVQAAMAGELISVSLESLTCSHGAQLRLEGGKVYGKLHAVALGAQAKYLLAVAKAADGNRLVLVDLAAAGVQKVAGMREDYYGVADLALFDAPALVTLDEAAVRSLSEYAVASTAALQQGVTQAQLERTVAYVSERKQFDRPIGSFQLVAGQMADGYILMQAQRSALSQLVWRLDEQLPSAPQAHALRAQSNELGLKVGRVAQHVHGGMGVDVTYPMHRFMFWCRALAVEVGSGEHHLEALGQWLADNDTLGWKYDLPEAC